MTGEQFDELYTRELYVAMCGTAEGYDEWRESMRKREAVIARVMAIGQLCFEVPKPWWNPFARRRCHMCGRGPCRGPEALYEEFFPND